MLKKAQFWCSNNRSCDVLSSVRKTKLAFRWN